VGVDGDARDAERVAEDDVRGLAADAGQRHQVDQTAGDLAVVPLLQRPTELDQRIGLVAEEPGGPDQLLQLRPVGARVGRGGRVAREELRGDLVDPLVGALGREDRGDGQLQRSLVVQLAVRVGVRLGQQAGDPARPPLAAQGGLGGGGGARHTGQGTSPL
jgi:hypothetical protein